MNILQKILVKMDSKLKGQTGTLLGVIPLALRSVESGVWFSRVFPICPSVQALLPSRLQRESEKRL